MHGRHGQSRWSVLAPLSACAVALLAGVAHAALPGEAPAGLDRTPFGALIARVAPTNPALEDALAAFASDDFTLRERATTALIEDGSIPEDAIWAAVRREGMTEEQRERCVAALRERFFRAERPALGIQMEQQAHELGVIVSPKKGFPAFDMLRDNDVVLSIDGLSLRMDGGGEFNAAQSAMRAAIMSHVPGECVALRVLRGEDTVEIEAPLGRFADLELGPAGAPPRFQTGDPAFVLPEAWAIRMARLGVGDGAATAIAAAARPEQWVSSARAMYRAGAGEGLVPGGHAGGAGGAQRLALATGRDNVRVIIAQPNDGGGVRVVPVGGGQGAEWLRPTIEAWQARIAAWRTELADPNITPERRNELQGKVIQGENTVNQLRERLNNMPRR